MLHPATSLEGLCPGLLCHPPQMGHPAHRYAAQQKALSLGYINTEYYTRWTISTAPSVCVEPPVCREACLHKGGLCCLHKGGLCCLHQGGLFEGPLPVT